MHNNKLINFHHFFPLSPQQTLLPASQPYSVLWKHKKKEKKLCCSWRNEQEWGAKAMRVLVMEFVSHHHRTGFRYLTERPDCLVYAHTKWTLLGQEKWDQDPAIQYRNKLSYLKGLKLLYRKRRKGCFCKMPTKTHQQTHLHLPDRQSAFNFSALAVPVAPSQPVSFLLHHHVKKAL